MSEHYTAMYQGENLYSYQMKNNEKSLVENLRRDCIEICDRLDIPRLKRMDGSLHMGRLLDDHDFCIKYKRKIGYFVLDGERGIFTIRDKFPEQDREKAKFRVLTTEFQTGGFRYELENRSALQQIWLNIYNSEYDSRKAAFEYAIQKHVESLSCFVDEVVAEYTGYMNRWFEEPHWFYNKDTMQFEEINPS